MNEPPPKKKSPLKWILLGCGALVVLGVLCIGGSVGLGAYMLKKTINEVAKEGEPYLRRQSEIEAELGTLTKVEHQFWAGSQVVNDKAVMNYKIEGPKGTAEATVWFEKQGSWAPVGCEVRISGGKTLKIGRSFDMPKSKSSSWDD